MDIKSIVKDNNVTFSYFRNGLLWYDVVDNATDKRRWSFPVDVSNDGDIGGATFPCDMKAITLMRYIRKAIASEQIFEHKGITP
jgi:hypothetical protein